jgi:hypothetical protein
MSKIIAWCGVFLEKYISLKSEKVSLKIVLQCVDLTLNDFYLNGDHSGCHDVS